MMSNVPYAGELGCVHCAPEVTQPDSEGRSCFGLYEAGPSRQGKYTDPE